MAKAYAHLQAPIVPVKGDGFNLLGDHFHPILILLGPIWRLFPTPLSLRHHPRTCCWRSRPGR